MSFKRHGRKRPYTETGIKRLPCCRCGDVASLQWQVCSDANLYRPLCEHCDIKLNAMVLRWMRDPDAVAKGRAYAAAKGGS